MHIDEKILNGIVNNEIKFTGKVNAEVNFIGNSLNFNKGDLLLDFRDVKIESYIIDWAKPRFSPMILKSDIIFLDYARWRVGCSDRNCNNYRYLF